MKNWAGLICLIISLAACSQNSKTSEWSATPKSNAIDSLLKTAHEKKQFFGNVLVAENGKIVYQGSFGTADYATGAKLNAETMFELASVSKQFTAMGIMLLKKQGKLSYDDSLRKFFPELPYHNITVRQLLNHTSGLPDYMNLMLTKGSLAKIATNKDMIALLAAEKPAIVFAPGEKWEYSNTGYALLASIIEKASGESFPDYLQKNIFRPLEMKRTMVYRRRFEKKTIDNYALGYVYNEIQKKYILPDDQLQTRPMVWVLDGIMGDGTVNSTTGDLLIWDRALYTEKLVSKAMMAEAFSPGLLNNGEKTTYGFGWLIGQNKTIGKFVNHSGGWPGYATMIERHIDSNKTIIILRNHDGPISILQKIRDILYNVKVVTPVEVIADTSIFSQYLGKYELAPEFIITVTTEGGKIYGQATGQERFEMFAEKKDAFFLKVVEAKITFTRDEKGVVKSMTLFQNGQEIPGNKIN
jgi:CubicO group peptidase (beta-lactamase class C family)